MSNSNAYSPSAKRSPSYQAIMVSIKDRFANLATKTSISTLYNARPPFSPVRSSHRRHGLTQMQKQASNSREAELCSAAPSSPKAPIKVQNFVQAGTNPSVEFRSKRSGGLSMSMNFHSNAEGRNTFLKELDTLSSNHFSQAELAQSQSKGVHTFSNRMIKSSFAPSS